MAWIFREVPALAAMVVLVVIMVVVQQTQAARILMVVPICPRSHNNFFMPIAEHLAQRNHTVTYLTEYEMPKRPNIHVVVVPDVQIYDKLPNLFTTNAHTAMASVQADLQTVCVKVLGYEGVQSLLNEKFDLIILHARLTECFLSFVHKMQVPFIFVYPNRIMGMLGFATGSPTFPSLTASFFIDLDYPLTFMGRVLSTSYNLMGYLWLEWFIIPSQEAECRARKLCPDDMPSLTELRLNSSLFITNSVRTMEYPTLPYTPTVVHAGGIHCRPAQPLPEDLQQWVASAGKPGFIFFSLGTLVKPSSMPEKYRKVLLEVFGSLEQRVLWKWDENNIKGLPSNVRLSKWLPQQDILGHPELRLFITHGGLLSTQEAIYHGMPILGMPVTADQHHNMRIVQRENRGRILDWEDLTYDSLRGHILHIMEDSKLQQDVERSSRLMRDQPISPADWTTYWIEYVIRHQGATHLRSPVIELHWYQLYNVDVWALVVVVTIATAGLVSWLYYRILKALLCFCFGSNKTKKD